MATSYKKVVLDVAKENNFVCYAKTGDALSRYLDVRLVNAGTPLTLGSGESVAVTVQRADGAKVTGIGSVSYDGTAIVELTSNMLAVPGTCTCEVTVVAQNGAILTSLSFLIEVEQGLRDDDAAAADDEFPIFTQAIAEMAAKGQAAEEAAEHAESVAAESVKLKDAVPTFTDLPANPSVGDAYRVKNIVVRSDRPFFSINGGASWYMDEDGGTVKMHLFNGGDGRFCSLAYLLMYALGINSFYEITPQSVLDQDVTSKTFYFETGAHDETSWELEWSEPYTLTVTHAKIEDGALILSGSGTRPSGSSYWPGEMMYTKWRWDGISINDRFAVDSPEISFVMPTYPAMTAFCWTGATWEALSPDTEYMESKIAEKADKSHNHSALNISSGTLPVARGGTGNSTWSTNRIIYASSTVQLKQVALPSGASVLCQGSSGAPYWTAMTALGGIHMVNIELPETPEYDGFCDHDATDFLGLKDHAIVEYSTPSDNHFVEGGYYCVCYGDHYAIYYCVLSDININSAVAALYKISA